jgi:hypothetical protein
VRLTALVWAAVGVSSMFGMVGGDCHCYNMLTCNFHALVFMLIADAERSPYKPQPRLVILARMSPLVPWLRVHVVRHSTAQWEGVHAYLRG